MALRHVIVGNGPAGLTAAETIRLHDADAHITIVGGEDHPFYSRPGLAYVLTGAIPEKQLFARTDKDYERAQIRRTVGTVRRIEPAGHRIELTDGRTLAYDCLLLAVGARAVRPELPGIDLEGVVTLDNLDDARRILRLAKKAKRACVVGGGITALELAEGLAAQGVETRYLMRGDRYWSGVLDPHESTLVEARLVEDGIRLHHGVELAAVIGNKGRVTAVETRAGDRLSCDLLGVAVGVQPRLELAQQIGLPTGRGIWTDETLQTADPYVFAAGDVAEVLDPATGRRGVDSLWSIAIEQGRTAGENMTGLHRPYRRPAPFNVTKLGGVTTTIIGAVGSGGRDGDLVTLARGDSGAWRERLDSFAVAADTGVNHLRLMLGANLIVGAVVMGDQALSRGLQHLIREQVDISLVRDLLVDQAAEAHQVVAALAERMVSLGTL